MTAATRKTNPAAVRGLRTVALVKQVPRGDEVGALDAEGRLRREGFTTEMNPWCRRAVTRAVRLSGQEGRAWAVTMGPPSAAGVLREAMACGVHDALHVTDRALAGADCLATAKVLAAAVRRIGPVDVVTVGRSSVDGNTAAVGAMVAELLGFPFVGPVLGLDVADTPGGVALHATVQSEEGGRPVTVSLPAVVAVAERSCDPAKAAPESWPDASRVTTIGLSALTGGDPVPPVSPTKVVGVLDVGRTREPLILSGPLAEQVARALDLCEAPGAVPLAVPPLPPRAPACSGTRRADVVVLTDGADPAGDRALLGEAAVLAERTGGRVVAVAPPDSDISRFAAWGADEVSMLGGAAPRCVAAALAGAFTARGIPWALLGSVRSGPREVLARLAARLDCGLMSDLVALGVVPGSPLPRLVGSKPSGSASMAEIVSYGAVQVATVRTGCLPSRGPRPAGAALAVRSLAVPPDPDVRVGTLERTTDYDALERADVVIGVGRGVDPGHYGELLPLRRLLGAELAATRKVTDAGWLPHTLQVGVTARDIAPRLYIALGLSGNGNHMSGAGRARTVLAVNSDAAAPVFGACDIGIVADWREVVPLLAAEMERRRTTVGAAGSAPGAPRR